MQSHLISWFFSLQPAPQCFKLWVWSHVWVWLRKNYLSSLSRHWVSGVGEGGVRCYPVGGHPCPVGESSFCAAHWGSLLTGRGGSTARAGLWHVRVLPRREMERWNLLCEQNRKESGFPPEIKKNTLNFASTSSSTFKAAPKPFRL